VLVPKATVDEDRLAAHRENDIRLARQAAYVESIPVSQREK
jgi:hypothetical protein